MSESDCDNEIPEDILDAAKQVRLDSLPQNSKLRYTATYNKFKQWRKIRKTSSFAEDVILVYISDLECSPNSLWSIFSMLKTCIQAFDNIDISSYSKVIAHIKRKNVGYKPKKSKVFTVNDISRLCNENADPDWLVYKIICIVGVTGACRRGEITNIVMGDIEDHQTMLLIKIPKTKTYIERSFTVVGDFYKLLRQYLDIRSSLVTSLAKKNKKCSDRLFLRMSGGKCENKPIGINKIGEVPKMIAKFLKLSNPELYTGHCFRRTSATVLADSGIDITTLKRHTGHKSTTVAEGYINESLQNKVNIGKRIEKSINISAQNPKKRSSENIDPLPHRSEKMPRHYYTEPSTSTGKTHTVQRKTMIPETQSSDELSQCATVGTQSSNYQRSEIDEEIQELASEFAEEFSSEMPVQAGSTQRNIDGNDSLFSSQQISNLLNSDEKVTIEMKNCSNITFNFNKIESLK